MRRMFGVIVATATVLTVIGVAAAQMTGGMGGGGMMGGGHMGSGMMGRDTGTGSPPEITAEQAQEAAIAYVKQYLPDFTVKSTTPLPGMHMTMYQAELSGPDGQSRTLHINPWGNVMQFGGPVSR